LNRRQLTKQAVRLSLLLSPALHPGLSLARSKPAPDYAQHPAAQAFAEDLAQRRGWDLAWLQRHIGRARRVTAVQQAMMPAPAGTAKDWAAYRARFIEPRRLAAGQAFAQANQSALQQAESRFGVPSALILGIIGVETFYGRVMGRYRLLDALATLSFDFPRGRSDRSALFRGELEALLELSQRHGRAPDSYVGSYAGAWGLPQFLPSSVLRHAVDLDGDGRIDLDTSAADAIGSVAHYLNRHGWRTGMPTHHAVEPPSDAAQLARLLEPDILPSFTAEEMRASGARLDAAGSAHPGPMALVKLENGAQAPSYVAGTENFYVVTRYNRSSYYALAVIELAQALQES
jgi:membrane-bound lytic murein transglycosylase B